jgi:hypothetical protein
MKAVMIALVDAAIGDRPTHIDVTTMPMGWTVSVRHIL